jgi:uncharacterized protein
MSSQGPINDTQDVIDPMQPRLETAPAGPVTGQERYQSMDALRGVAVLGILLMNIPVFALPEAYMMNPSLPEQASAINVPYWLVGLLFFEGKMRALFSMLFGAGCVLITSRVAQRNTKTESGDIYYRRTILLMLFGLMHGYLLWEGDILFWYGAMGLLLFPFRKLSGTVLVIAGLGLAAIFIPQGFYRQHVLTTMRVEAEQADEAAGRGKPLTEEQTAARQAWQARQKRLKPPTEQEIEKQIKSYQGDWWSIFKLRARRIVAIHSIALYEGGLPDILAFMVLGMGFYKLGLFTAVLSTRLYAVLAIAGFAIGLLLTAYLGKVMIDSNYMRSEHLLLFHMKYGIDRISVALGYTGLLMVILRCGWLTWLTSRLAAVGQMALSNYLMQSAICTTIFYGYGFGLFGKLYLHQLTLVVFGVWVLQLLISQLWLRYFRFGPVEWLWRSLTYLKWQPFLREHSQVLSVE